VTAAVSPTGRPWDRRAGEDRTRRPGEPAVVVAAVTHGERSPGSPILADVSLTAMPGQVVVVEGRSGSGKSTLCQLVAGLEQPDRGSVSVGGVPAATLRDWGRLALLPQRLGLPAELTVTENVMLPRWMRGLASRPELLEAFDLVHLADRLTAQASRGEQQRVAIARAASLDPDVIVLDEPTSHQDEAHADVVAEQLLQLARTGSAVLVATHDPRLVAEADQVVHLHAGRHASG
jgi:putative ABC transport system ATP-binding protein